MLNCLLNFLLLLTAFVDAENSEIEGLKQFALNSNDSVASFFPNKTTIGENELNQLEKTLDRLDDGKTKEKREVRYNLKSLDDEDDTNSLKNSKSHANFEVKSSGTEVDLPEKSGSPAFSIHASKVYILYPSLFQDPNIFGRFSIPQNINLDPIPDKQPSSSSNHMKREMPDIIKPITNPPAIKNVNSNPYNPYKANNNRRLTRRNADAPDSNTAQNSEDSNKKRNIETHLSGTIVVLNQDVNEINRKDAY